MTSKPAAPASSSTTSAAPRTSPAAPFFGLIAGLAAGLLTSVLFKPIDDALKLTPELAAVNGMSSQAKQDEQKTALGAIQQKEVTALSGLMGALTALLLGAIGLKTGPHHARLRTMPVITSSILTAALAIAGGIIGSGLPDHWGVRETTESFLKTGCVRGIMFALVGLGCGLMLGKSVSTRISAGVFGAVGGAIAGVAVPMIVSTLFVEARTEQFLSSDLKVNALSLGIAGAFIGLFAMLGRSQSSSTTT